MFGNVFGENAATQGRQTRKLSATLRLAFNPLLPATYAVGTRALFTITAAFTFATYYLAEPLYALGTLLIGN